MLGSRYASQALAAVVTTVKLRAMVLLVPRPVVSARSAGVGSRRRAGTVKRDCDIVWPTV